MSDHIDDKELEELNEIYRRKMESQKSHEPKKGQDMSVVIIGGNERMETRYADICKAYGYDKAKVFVKENSSLKKKVGTPDLLILFTNTVSHKMMLSATQEAKRNSVPVARVHSSSVVALSQLLAERSASL